MFGSIRSRTVVFKVIPKKGRKEETGKKLRIGWEGFEEVSYGNGIVQPKTSLNDWISSL